MIPERSWLTLPQTVTRHEATVQKRWLKKTRRQRLSILLDAWPAMAAVHRPNFRALQKESGSAPYAGGTEYQGHFKWPYINKEDLVKPQTRFLLLNWRGHHPPSTLYTKNTY